MESVVAERKKNGPFKSLYDFAERLEAKTINRRQLENLAKSGALDPLERERARAHAACDVLNAYAQRVAEDKVSAQTSLFGTDEPSVRPALPPAPSWSAQERLDAERESVGFYLSGHPLSAFFSEPISARYSTFSDIQEEGDTGDARFYPMAGVVRRVMYKPAMSGGTLAFVSLSDPTGDFELMVMPEGVAQARERLEVGKPVVFRGKVRWRDGDMKLSGDSFEPLEAAEARTMDDLRIFMKESAKSSLKTLSDTIGALPPAIASEARNLRLVLKLNDGREVHLQPPRKVPSGAGARAAMKAVKGVERVT